MDTNRACSCVLFKPFDMEAELRALNLTNVNHSMYAVHLHMMCGAGVQGAPDNSRAGKGVVNNASQVVVMTEGNHSRDVCYLQQRVADCFYVKHLPHSNRLVNHLLYMAHKTNMERHRGCDRKCFSLLLLCHNSQLSSWTVVKALRHPVLDQQDL